MMENVPGCEVFHINTGIGIERTREYVRDTCKTQGWPLHEIRAKEDCGQDYDNWVRRFGFPGPDGHQLMYSRLKERGIRLLLRRTQTKRGERVLFATGIRHDESVRRMKYGGREVNRDGAMVWANPLYWWTKAQRDEYNRASGLPKNTVCDDLGMSGECGCGAFAHKGELERWRKVDPSFGERIDRLSAEALALGFTWSWEAAPPAGGYNKDQHQLFHPLCFGCEKSAVVQSEITGQDAVK